MLLAALGLGHLVLSTHTNLLGPATLRESEAWELYIPSYSFYTSAVSKVDSSAPPCHVPALALVWHSSLPRESVFPTALGTCLLFSSFCRQPILNSLI